MNGQESSRTRETFWEDEFGEKLPVVIAGIERPSRCPGNVYGRISPEPIVTFLGKKTEIFILQKVTEERNDDVTFWHSLLGLVGALI